MSEKNHEPDALRDVEKCPTHFNKSYFNDCEKCRQEKTDSEAVIKGLSDRCQALGRSLATHGVQMPQELLTAYRVDILIEALGLDDRVLYQMEAELGRRVTESLETAQQEVTRAQLGAQPQGLHVVKNGSPRP